MVLASRVAVSKDLGRRRIAECADGSSVALRAHHGRVPNQRVNVTCGVDSPHLIADENKDAAVRTSVEREA